VADDIRFAAGALQLGQGPQFLGLGLQPDRHLGPGDPWVAVSALRKTCLQGGQQNFNLTVRQMLSFLGAAHGFTFGNIRLLTSRNSPQGPIITILDRPPGLAGRGNIRPVV